MEKKYENKTKRQSIQAKNSYKAYHSAIRYDKYVEAHADQLDKFNSGTQYEKIVAVKVSKKSPKSCTKTQLARYVDRGIEMPLLPSKLLSDNRS